MNMSGAEKTVYVEMTWSYSLSPREDLLPVWLDIDNCNDSQLPTVGGYEDIHWQWTSNLTGTIVGIGGHLHDGGISIAAVNGTTGANQK